MSTVYDAIVIGTGAGGGTLALHLAQAGKRILILERGAFLPQEKLNWDTSAVFLDNRYHTKEVWQDKDGKDLHPQQAYFVGGQTKVYGAAMFRMRAEDFGEIVHQGGISPAWPISYADLEPYYTRAEELFHVHGDLGSAPPVAGGLRQSFDPTEPFHSKPYPFPAMPSESRMKAIEDDVRKLGINTFPIPLGLKRNDADPLASKCVRCDTCDGYPMPGPRQVGRGHQLHSGDHASAQCDADDQRARDPAADQRDGDGGDLGGGGACGQGWWDRDLLSGPLRAVRGRGELGGGAAGVGE
jgi:choline dehydrogenase-like flavoprotein